MALPPLYDNPRGEAFPGRDRAGMGGGCWGGRWDLAEGGGKEGSEATPSPPSQASRREVTSSAQGLQNMVI